MANKKQNLEKLLENLLNEADPNVRPTSIADFQAVPEAPVSLDQMIDRYLVQYEREAIPTSEMFESARLEKLTEYLLEQEINPKDDDDDESGGEFDLGGLDGPGAGPGAVSAPATDSTAGFDLDLGGEEDAADDEDKAPPAVQTPRINLQDFTRSIARLVNNFQSLINFKTIILNRAKRYIQNNYDERTAKEMMEILDTSYDLRSEDMTNHQNGDTEFPQPRTGVTGPVGG